MKKINFIRIIYPYINVILILLSMISITYLTVGIMVTKIESKTIFNTVNNDYTAILGKEYIHDVSYLTDITCMKMEIASYIITESSALKKQYFDNMEDSDTLDRLKDSLSHMQEYNKEIRYNKPSVLIAEDYSPLYSALNYMTYGNDALIIDIINFLNEENSLAISVDKDVQQIHVMANVSQTIINHLNKQINFHLFIIFAHLLVLFGTCTNVLRLKAKNKYYKKNPRPVRLHSLLHKKNR